MTYISWLAEHKHVAVGYFVGWVLAEFFSRLTMEIHNSWTVSVLILIIGFSIVSYIWYRIDKRNKNAVLDESDKI
jgi:putative Mn2+ efflux pump MntP